MGFPRLKLDEGSKLENFVATCLLKHVFAKTDYAAQSYALHYLQTKEKQEVNFALVYDNKVKQMIEVKAKNHHIGLGLHYFHEKYQLPAIQIVKDLKREIVKNGIEVILADNFLKSLDL